MAVYIIGFVFSVFLIYYAESKRFHGNTAKTSVVIALLIPCLIAGLRDATIGTDVQGYIEPLFQVAQSADSLLEFLSAEYYSSNIWAYTQVSGFEIGFTVLCYISAKVFRSMPVLLFVIQALTVIPIYKGLRYFGRTQPVWLGMAVYYLMFYNQTLNMMRQWIAMAFLFYAFRFLASSSYYKYFLTMVIAALFHYSAVLGLVIFVVYQLVTKKNDFNKRLKVFLLILLGVCSLLSLDFFVSVLAFFGLRYSFYISGSIALLPNQFILRIPILLMLFLRWRQLKSTNRYANFYLVMIAYDLLCSQLASIFAQSGRIGLFFNEYYMLAYPAICMASDSRNNRRMMRVVVLCFLCFYWWFMYVYMGRNDTIPYKSVWA